MHLPRETHGHDTFQLLQVGEATTEGHTDCTTIPVTNSRYVFDWLVAATENDLQYFLATNPNWVRSFGVETGAHLITVTFSHFFST